MVRWQENMRRAHDRRPEIGTLASVRRFLERGGALPFPPQTSAGVRPLVPIRRPFRAEIRWNIRDGFERAWRAGMRVRPAEARR